MWEKFVLDIAKSVLITLIPYFVKMLVERASSGDQPNMLREEGNSDEIKTQITKMLGEEEKGDEIKTQITKKMQEKHGEINIEDEDRDQFISKVMSEIQKLATKFISLINLEDEKNQMRSIMDNSGGDEDLKQQQLTVHLEEQLEKAVDARREELTQLSSPPEEERKQTPQNEGNGEDENPVQPSLPNTKVPEITNVQPKEKMPNYLENLRQYKEYGESILKGITSFNENQSLPDKVRPKLSKCLEELDKSAKKTKERATSPVKIAIMGETGSGKTLLVGSLIGYADALPVNEIPTTGNVTAIHLQQKDEGTTEVGQFKVKYLSEQGVKKCLDFMLLEAQQRAKAAGLASTQLAQLESLKNSNPVDWNGILQWCEQAWNSRENVELRYLIRELVVLASNYQAYGKDICDQTYEIPTTEKEGLKLAEAENILQSDFSSLSPVLEPWQNRNKPSALELQNSFSLIQHIEVTVEVSEKIWDLSPLKGSNEFVLLDFPGLGSESSGVRDTFLSMMAIEEVQTFLLLLNGRDPATAESAPAKIRTKIQEYKGEDIKDRMIVGVGRFNQLPLNTANRKVLDELIDDERPFEPSSQEVLSALDILKQIIISAENLTTKKDRILLLSQTFGLAKLAEESRLVQVCSPEFQPELEQVNKSVELRQKWKKLSDILLKHEPYKTLGRQLSDFADDGGIGRLRSLLQEHVAEHGLKQLDEDTRKVSQTLRQQQNNLRRILENIQDNPIPENSPAYANLRQAIDSLRTNYRDLIEDLRKQSLLKCNGVVVSDVVKEELTFKIHRWDEWSVLFNSIENGIIKPASAVGGAVDTIFGLDEDHKSIPTKSDNFHSTFENTFKKLKDFARDRTQDALQELLSELSHKVEPQRHTLGEILHPHMEQQIQKNFGKAEARLVKNLKQSDDPNKWLDAIITEINKSNLADVRPQTINSQTFFPLANQDDKHEFGQIFDWSEEKQSSTSPRPFNHEFLVLRLRSEMVASAGLNLADYVSRLTEVVNSELLNILNVIIARTLLPLSNNEVLLRYIATGEQQTNNPPWLQTLSQILLIPYPKL